MNTHTDQDHGYDRDNNVVTEPNKLSFHPSRLRRENGVYDAALIKQNCPDIPDEAIMRLLFGGR